jgi:hypothetical protein
MELFMAIEVLPVFTQDDAAMAASHRQAKSFDTARIPYCNHSVNHAHILPEQRCCLFW